MWPGQEAENVIYNKSYGKSSVPNIDSLQPKLTGSTSYALISTLKIETVKI